MSKTFKQALNVRVESPTSILKNAIGVKTPKTPKELYEELNKKCEENMIRFFENYITTSNIISTDTIDELQIINSTKAEKFNIKFEYVEIDGKKHYYHCAIFGKNDTNNYDFKIRINKTNVWKNIRNELRKIGFSVVIITNTKTPNIWLINSINKDVIYKKINDYRILNDLPDMFDLENPNNELWHGLNNWLIENEIAPTLSIIQEPVKEIVEPVKEIIEPVKKIVEESVKEIKEPVKEIIEPVKEIIEPVKEIIESVKQIPVDELFITFPCAIIVIDNPKDIIIGEHYFNIFITNKKNNMNIMIDHTEYPIKRIIMGGMCDINDKFLVSQTSQQNDTKSVEL
jgi:hypothetical protein